MYRIVLYWLKLYQLPQHVFPRASDSVWTPQNAWPAAGKHWLSVKSVMGGQHWGAREHVVRDKLAGQYILYDYVVPCRRQITAVGPEVGHCLCQCLAASDEFVNVFSRMDAQKASPHDARPRCTMAFENISPTMQYVSYIC